ncbi:uncharacterized protein LOC110981631 isoform X2 [Acanthaster planci]|uniref:Netrin receptor UNC5 n=1 Tax=Acanthaster planci TaxID=133434 RepID=A0A8B7YP41_ACAPL|nr:uncharacterized protein LOC110981631 isoform X2 [Acanthaster planci]
MLDATVSAANLTCTSIPSSMLDDKYFRQLASSLGHEWLKLASYLDFSRDVIDRLQEDYRRAEECIFQMLVSWRQNSDWRLNNSLKLQGALVKCGRRDLADQLQDICLSDGFQQVVTLSDFSEESDGRPFEENRIQHIESNQHCKCIKRMNSIEHLQMLRAEFHQRFAHLHGMDRLGSLCHLVDFVAGYFDFYGGTLGLPEYDVHLYIPQGAIPSGKIEEVYLYVNPMVQSVSGLHSRALLSPLVECGPSGLKFLKSVVLHLPHFATNGGTGWDITAGVSYSESEDTHSDDWNNLSPDENSNLIINQQQIILALDHFSTYAAIGTPFNEDCGKTMKIYISPINSPTDSLNVHVLIWNNINITRQCVIRSHERLAFGVLDEACYLNVTWHGGDLMLQLNNTCPGYKVETTKKRIAKEVLWENQVHSVTFDLSVDTANHSGAAKKEWDGQQLCNVDIYQRSWGPSRSPVHLSVHHPHANKADVSAKGKQKTVDHSKTRTGSKSERKRNFPESLTTGERNSSQTDDVLPWKFKISVDLGQTDCTDGTSHLLRGIAAYRSGEIVVSDFVNNQLVICNIKNVVQAKIPLERVWDVAVLPNNNLVAVDETSEVKVFTENHTLAFTFTTKPAAVDKAQVGLVSAAVGEGGNIFIGDAFSNVVSEHLPADGTLVGTRKLHVCPHFLAVNRKGQLLVSGWNACKVDIMDDRNVHIVIQTIHPTIRGKPAWCLGVCCSTKDDIFIVVTSSNDRLGHVHRYNTQGDFEECIVKGLHKPRGIVCIDDTKLAVANDNTVMLFEKQDS